MEGFYNKCFISNFEIICYFGYIVLFFGFILLLFNILAFIKMTKYYGKMHFENSILLLSSLQSIMIIIQMIITRNYFICIFLFIQILSMFLINNKFKKISVGYIIIKYEFINKIILIVNAAYLVIYNISHLFKTSINLFYLNIFYYLLEIFSSFYLSYYCCIFLNFIKQSKLITEINENKKLEKRKSDKNQLINMAGDGLFYLIKQKQLSLLYLANIICSFLEFIFDVLVNFINKEKTSYYLINYIYDFIFLIHNSIIFICFYWIIREQYNPNTEKSSNNHEEKTDNLIDEKFIEEEQIIIEEENKRISGYLNDDKNDIRKVSTESDDSKDENKRKTCDNDKEKAQRKVSRSSTFDENDEIIGPNVINIEDIPSNDTNE